MNTIWTLIENEAPYPFVLMADRYGGSYSGGNWLCFWGLWYPDEIFMGDTDCFEIWERIKGGKYFPTAGSDNRGWGVGKTPEEAVIAAAKMAQVLES